MSFYFCLTKIFSADSVQELLIVSLDLCSALSGHGTVCISLYDISFFISFKMSEYLVVYYCLYCGVLFFFVSIRCWEINENVPHWWIIRTPILLAILVMHTHATNTYVKREDISVVVYDFHKLPND